MRHFLSILFLFQFLFSNTDECLIISDSENYNSYNYFQSISIDNLDTYQDQSCVFETNIDENVFSNFNNNQNTSDNRERCGSSCSDVCVLEGNYNYIEGNTNDNSYFTFTTTENSQITVRAVGDFDYFFIIPGFCASSYPFNVGYQSHIHNQSPGTFYIHAYGGSDTGDFIMEVFHSPVDDCQGFICHDYFEDTCYPNEWLCDGNLDCDGDEYDEMEENCESSTLGDMNEDGALDVIDIVNLVNTVLAWTYNPLGDMNEDGANDVVDIVLLVNLVLYGSQDDDVSIVGTWQAYEYNLFTGDNCENLEYQLEGPIFDTGDLPEWDDDEEDCDEYVAEHTGYEYTQIWWSFDEDNNFIKYDYEDSDQLIEEMEDNDCLGVFSYCQSYAEETIEKEFGIGEYNITDDVLTKNVHTFLEFKNGWDENTSDDDCDGNLDYEDSMIFDNCIDGPYNENNSDSYILEINENYMIVTEIYTEYFGENEDVPMTFCEEMKFERFDNLEIEGCMDSNYENYNPYATSDDGTCTNNQCYGENANRKIPEIPIFQIFK